MTARVPGWTAAVLAVACSAYGEVIPGSDVETEADAASPIASPAPEHREFRAHDLVTIRIKDFLTFRNRMELNTERNTTLSVDLEQFFNVNRRRGDEARRTEQGDWDIQHETEGRGDERRSMNFERTMTAEVVAVRENGTVVLEGRSEMRFDQTVVTLTVTGVCRPDDINVRNEVASDRVHELRTNLQSRGPTPDAARQGWFVRFLNRIWPF